MASNGRFFRPEVPANLGGSSVKPMNISNLDDIQFFFPLSCTWHSLFRRQAQPGNHFRSQVQPGNEWTFNLSSLDRCFKIFLKLSEFNDKIQLMENFAKRFAPIPFSTKN
jgi:hypothetical protein